MQILNQGRVAEKIIKKTREERYLPGFCINEVPHSKLKSLPFSPVALGTILIDRRNLVHLHIYTNNKYPT